MSQVLAVEFDAAEALRAMELAPARTQRAVMRSLNRALTTGRAEMARRIAKDMSMKVGDAKEAVFTEQATPAKLSIRLVASKRRRPLFDFKPKQTRAGVTFVGRGGTRQLVPGAFLAGVQTGHAGVRHEAVFKRRGKKRLPIYELFGVSIGHVFEEHRTPVTTMMREAFEKNLAHELAFARTERA